MSRFISLAFLVFLIGSQVIFPACGGATKNGGVGSDTKIPTITLKFPDGYSVERASGRITPKGASSALTTPSYITGVTLTVTGEGITPLIFNVPLDTGIVSGLLSPGDYTFSVVVTTNIGLTFSGSTNKRLVQGANSGIAIDLLVNAPPVITSITISNKTPTVGDTVTARCSATDADGDAITYAWSGSASGVGQSVSHNIPADGRYTFTCAVSDGRGGVVTASASATAGTVAPPPPITGCTDPTATNYNPTATVDDGSCVYAGDTTPPVTTVALAQVSITPSGWTGSATIDEVGTGYCIAWPNLSLAPTAAQVKAGAGGTVAMTANATANCQVTGLNILTTYGFYFVAEDASGNLQTNAAISGPVIATTPDPLITSLVFADPLLANCVNTRATSMGWTTVSQMTSLSCSGNGFASLIGIDQLTALTSLNVSVNLIVDVTPLAGLTALTTLSLANNLIGDVTPLSGLTALLSLSLVNNLVGDVTPLAGLTALTTLSLANNQVVNVTPLATLTALTNIDLSANQIGGLGIGNIHLLSPMPTAKILLNSNLGQSCSELGTLIANYPGRVGVDGNFFVGNPGDVATNGVTCTNP